MINDITLGWLEAAPEIVCDRSNQTGEGHDQADDARVHGRLEAALERSRVRLVLVDVVAERDRVAEYEDPKLAHRPGRHLRTREAQLVGADASGAARSGAARSPRRDWA
jgi:hypothetical protein